MLAQEPDPERTDRDLTFVAGVEGECETEENEAQFQQHFIPMEAVAPADEALQCFHAHGRHGSQHDSTI